MNTRITDNLAIGVLASSALGAELTQTTLDTFHSAGIDNDLVSRGIFRIEELLNNSSTLNKITFTISNIPATHTLPYLLIKNLTIAPPKQIDLKSCVWLHTWQCVYGELELPDTNYMIIEVWLGVDNMIKHHYTIESLKNICTPVPLAVSPLLTFNDLLAFQLLFMIRYDEAHVYETTHTILPPECPLSDRILFLKYKVWIPLIENIHLSGLKGVSKVVPITTDPPQYLLICDSNTLMENVIHIDPYNIICNKISYMMQIYGIEVAKRCLLEELYCIMPQILKCHIEVIVDKMTWSGTIASISRYSARTDPDVLKRISFEEASRNIQMACIDGECDQLVSTSSRLVASKRIW